MEAAKVVRRGPDSVCSPKPRRVPEKAISRVHGQVECSRTGRQRVGKSLDRSFKRLLDSFFGCAAAHGVTQKPTPLINQGLRHNWQ
jgi:hypothetical protein